MNPKDKSEEKSTLLELENRSLKKENQELKDTISHFKTTLRLGNYPIVVPKKGGVFLIPPQSVIAVLSVKECVDVYINVNALSKITKEYCPKHKVTLRRTMKEVSYMFGQLYYFLEIKRGCIININYLESIDKNGVVTLKEMKEDIKVKMASSKWKKLKSSFGIGKLETADSFRRKFISRQMKQE